MDRRTFISGVSVGLLAAPLAAQAQPAGKAWRIGVLSAGSSSATREANIDAFKQGLRELGYVEGHNIVIESRWGAGKYESLRGLAAELVRLKMDVIVTVAVPALLFDDMTLQRPNGDVPNLPVTKHPFFDRVP